MARTIDRLKDLALKCTSATDVNQVEGETIDEVLDYIAKNFKDFGGASGDYATKTELNGKQDKTDNALTTTDKTTTGAINELKTKNDTQDTSIADLNKKIVKAVVINTDASNVLTGGTLTFTDDTTINITINKAQ